MGEGERVSTAVQASDAKAAARKPGVARRSRDWLKAHPTIRWTIIVALILAVLVSIFFTWLTIHFLLGEDLIVGLEANQTSFRITNAEQAPAQVALETDAQLFCTTLCNLTVFNVSTQEVAYSGLFTMRSGDRIEQGFNFSPSRVGEGQELYSVTASCRNVRSLLCPTLAPERRKTVLIAVNYNLSTDEARVKPALKAQLETMLASLRATDILLQEENVILARNPRLHAGSLLANITGTQDEFYKQKLFLENARQLWQQESYLVLYRLLQNSTVTQERIDATRADAAAIKQEMLRLAQLHNSIRDDLEGSRQALNSTVASHYLPPTGLVEPLVNRTNLLVASYNASFDYTRMHEDVSSLHDAVLQINVTLAGREAAAVLAGDALIAQETAELCSRNITCENASTAGAATGADSAAVRMGDICTQLSLLSMLGATQLMGGNVTNESTPTIDSAVNGTANEAANRTMNDTLAADARAYLAGYCVNGTIATIDMSQLDPLRLLMPENVTSDIATSIAENAPQCCVFGSCKPCCNTASCADDPDSYPVLFVHGHAFNDWNSPEYSLGGYFSRIQHRLQQDGYLDAGVITPSSTTAEVGPGEWGLSGRPVTVRVTYYYNFYRAGSEYVLVPQNSESIETYAIRLKEMIDVAKHNTGKQKVNIVAHSMGGLVVRKYLQLFGEDSVDKVILIGTPDAGIDARTKKLCPVFGASKECDDMAQGSVFMRKLNDSDAQPKQVRFVTITGHGCSTGGNDGDGVVEASSVPLPHAKNYDINGTCTSFFGTDLHTELLNIDEYPGVYGIIKDELKK